MSLLLAYFIIRSDKLSSIQLRNDNSATFSRFCLSRSRMNMVSISPLTLGMLATSSPPASSEACAAISPSYLRAAFMQIPKAHKRQSNQAAFCAFGTCSPINWAKHVDEIDPSLAISPTIYQQLLRQCPFPKKLQTQTVRTEKLHETLSNEKPARKMLVKLTPVLQPRPRGFQDWSFLNFFFSRSDEFEGSFETNSRNEKPLRTRGKSAAFLNRFVNVIFGNLFFWSLWLRRYFFSK